MAVKAKTADKTQTKTTVKTETENKATQNTITETKTTKAEEKEVQIKILTKIRADFGAFDAGQVVTVAGNLANVLIKTNRAQKV